MRIALDYDDTFTRDPEVWRSFIFNAEARGHEIRIVTFRGNGNGAWSNNDDLFKALKFYNVTIPVVFCNGIRKRTYCESIGFFPDVWIDDMPEIIVKDGYVPGEMLARQIAIEQNE